MNDQVVLITGGTGGIGKETALALATMGATVVVTGRDAERGAATIAELKQRSGNSQIELILADLSTQRGVHTLAETFLKRHARLTVLINNAGLAESSRRLTDDGIEAHFALNVLTPFLLTHLLLPTLKASAPSRVINVTGGVHGNIDLTNLQAERAFMGLETYSHAKTVMMAVSYEFAQRLKGSGVTVNVCYPGQASTAMTRGVTPDMLPGLMRWFFPLFKWFVRDDGGKSASKASQSSIFLASSPSVATTNGQYFNTRSEPVAFPKAVMDNTVRQQLWTLCEQLTHL